eukprot:1102174-Alexandrium_andersonii.AAC.1
MGSWGGFPEIPQPSSILFRTTGPTGDLDDEMAEVLIDEECRVNAKDNDRWERRNRLSGGALERNKGTGKG